MNEVEVRFTDEDNRYLDWVWKTYSASTYNRRLAKLRDKRMERAGYRRGLPHWCGGSRVWYTQAEWDRWNANPANCPVPLAEEGGS